MLHVTNGDVVADALVAAQVEGQTLPWRDVLTDGPVPAGSSELLREARGAFLGKQFNDPDAQASLDERDRRLRDAVHRGESIMLWFEHDLYDQLQIVQVLDSLKRLRDEFRHTELTATLVCVDRHPDIEHFIGLGQLTPAQLLALSPVGRRVTDDMFRVAVSVWQAFTSPEPDNLVAVLDQDLTSLPFLRAAMGRWLEEYPWCQDGLSRTERQILERLENGSASPIDLFKGTYEDEPAPFMGDFSYWIRLAHMLSGPEPLIVCTSGHEFVHPPHAPVDDVFRSQSIELTDHAREVLCGKKDALSNDFRPRWFGGYCLEPEKPHWRWNTERRSLVPFAI